MSDLLWKVKYKDHDGEMININMLNTSKNGVIMELAMFHRVKELISIEEVR
ncbi:TPA: hypothetical protein QCX53_003492 [Bacillus cereus]|nr:hypothetical protein [Bacillus cereus]MEB8668806.1 hypothetical protein [Bacillus cereus]HDR7453447.1 hypothetical protein [Bacillus cereus]